MQLAVLVLVHRRKLLKRAAARARDPKIQEHHGRIVKTTGDGLLVEFASDVDDVVRCAVEMQRGMAVRSAVATLTTHSPVRDAPTVSASQLYR